MGENAETAILAGGCFWGVQELMRKQRGVIATRAGWTGGDIPNPTEANPGTHAEAVEIVFDPEQTSFRDILEFFFQIHDPTTINRQMDYIGTDYRSAIFYTSDEQKQVAEDTIADVDASGCGPARSPPRSSPPARSGRLTTRISTTCRNTPTARHAISRDRAGSCRTAKPRPDPGRTGPPPHGDHGVGH